MRATRLLLGNDEAIRHTRALYHRDLEQTTEIRHRKTYKAHFLDRLAGSSTSRAPNQKQPWLS